MTTNRLIETIDGLTRTFRFLKRTGCQGFSCSEKSLARLDNWEQTRSWSDRQILADIRAELGNCQRCRLAKSRRQIVFGGGNPGARLVFVGEAPGYEEDLKGEPFVGPAGRLLTKIIHAIEMTREAVYILNVIKCRPPQNRNPLPDEIEACSSFMTKQIRSIAPEFICTLGKFAAQTLLQTDQPISRLRGRFYDYQGIQLMPTFHPSYLLHNPGKKREVWQDMQKLMAAMKKSDD
jgi:DNA polymerase